MIKFSIKIISGGQTGVDRATLDAAIELGIEYGGSVPKGRIAEDGIVPLKYERLTELSTTHYDIRTEKNVLDSDATIVSTEGKPTGGTALTVQMSQKHNKPYIIVDFEFHKTPTSLIQFALQWLTEHKPKVINIAGPRESHCPGI